MRDEMVEIPHPCVCGGHRYGTVYEGKMDYWRRTWPEVQSDFAVLECASCALKRTWPMPYESDLETDLYRDGVQNDSYADLADRKAEYQATIAAFRYLVGKIPLKPEDGPLLDIGCAEGLLVREAQSLGWTAMGIDLDPVRIARGTERGVKNLFSGTLAEAPFRDGQFAAITASHVLEHVVELPSFLQTVERLLRPGGALVFEVPNYDSFTAQLMLRYPRLPWYGMAPHQHVWQFGPKGMSRVFALAAPGLMLERLTCDRNMYHGSQRPTGRLVRLVLFPFALLNSGDRLLGIARKSRQLPGKQ